MQTMTVSRQVLAHRRDNGVPQFYSFLASPVIRFEDTGWSIKLVATIAALGQAAWTGLFTWVFVLLLAASLLDWKLGVRDARAGATYDSAIATWGLNGKIATFVQVLVIALLEWRINETGWLETHGMGGTFVGVVMLMRELKSMDDRRVSKGGRPMPLLGWLLARLETMEEQLTPAVFRPGPHLRRRRRDDPPEEGGEGGQP